MTPLDVVRDWFDAWERGDADAARALLEPDAPAIMRGETVARGFDELSAWYTARRARLGASFAYRVGELLAGEHSAAALITLSSDRGSWQQVAVYRVRDGRIAELRAFEDPEP